MAAYLAADAIPRFLFAVLIAPEQAIAHKWLADAFNALARFSLVTIDDARVSMHRLLQKIVRDDARARNDTRAFTRALAALDDAFPTDQSDPRSWTRCEQLLAHVVALADRARHAGDMAPQLIGLLNRGCRYLIQAEGGPRALALAQRTVAQAQQQLLGADNPETLDAGNNLATACRHTGRTEEAIAILETLLAQCERIRGPEHPETLTARNNLAFAYQSAGRVQDAIAIYQPLLDDRERILGREHPHTLTTRRSLLAAYLVAGRLEDAAVVLEMSAKGDAR